jgi:hypothetical protein
VLAWTEKAYQGASFYTAPNPPFGALFTYYLKEELKSPAQQRKEREKKARSAGQEVAFPGWDSLTMEQRQDEPAVWLTVTDQSGTVVRRLKGPTGKGFHRVAWDLRYPPVSSGATIADDEDAPGSILVEPGTYKVSLSRQTDGVVSPLGGPFEFRVVPLRKGALEGSDPALAAKYWQEADELQRSVAAARAILRKALETTTAMKTALGNSRAFPGELDTALLDVRRQIMNLDEQINGSNLKSQIGQKNNPTVSSRLHAVGNGIRLSTYGPTPMLKEQLMMARMEFEELRIMIEEITVRKIPALQKALQDAGAPWLEGQGIPE